ncbi:MAG: ATP-binding cassette domain-containing protein, partial [Halothece sp.]
ILGIRQPDSGEVFILGENPNELKHKFITGAFLQKLKLPPNWDQEMLIQLIESHYPKTLGKVNSILNEFQLSQTKNSENLKPEKVKSLAGGEENILFFALAQAGFPKVLILDEPSSNLSVKNQKKMWNQVQNFIDQGNTVLFVCHDPEDQIDIKPNKILLLENGQVTLIEESQNCLEESRQTELNNFEPRIGLYHWITLLFQYIKFTILQTLKTDRNYLILTFLAGIIFSTLISLLPQLSLDLDKATSLIFYSFYFVLTAITMTGNIVSEERQNETLTKITKILPLPPIIYISAKVVVSLFFTSILILLMLTTFFVINGVSPLIWQSPLEFIKFISSILHLLPEILTLSIGFIIGLIPYVFLGVTLGYLFGQKSIQIIGLICCAALAIPIYIRYILEFLESSLQLSNKWIKLAELAGDYLAAYSPFYHYSQIILFLEKRPEYDQYILVHIVGFIWFTVIALMITLLTYRYIFTKEVKA